MPTPGQAIQADLVAQDGVTLWYNQPSSAYFSGAHERTYFAYTNNNSQVVVRYYDHSSATYSDEVIIDTIARRADDHLAPAIHIIQDGPDAGTILIAYAHHSSQLFVQRSDAAEDLSGFSQAATYTGYYTYPSFVDVDGELKLFFREGIGGEGQPKGMYNFISSSDDGASWSQPDFGAAFDNPWFTYGFPPIYADGELFMPFYFNRTDETEPNHRLAYAISHDGGASWTSTDGLTNRLTPDNAIEFTNSGNARIIDAARVNGEWLVSVTRFDNEFTAPGQTATGQIIRVSDGVVLYEREVAVNYYADGLVFDPVNPNFLYTSTSQDSPFDAGKLLMILMNEDFSQEQFVAPYFNDEAIYAIRPGGIANAQETGALGWLDVERYDAYFDFDTDLQAAPDGFDFIDLSAAVKSSRLDLADPSVNAGAARGMSQNADHVLGSDQSDSLRGTDETNYLFGGGARDYLLGRGGADWLDGGEGDDVLNGGADDDVLTGGAGSDYLIGGAGFDMIDYRQDDAAVRIDLADYTQNAGRAQGDRTSGIEGVYGSDHGNTLRGDANANMLVGGDSRDFLIGRGGDDILIAKGGDDHLWGHQGADTFVLDAVSGANTVHDFDRTQDRIRVDDAIADDLTIASDPSGGTMITIGDSQTLLKHFDYQGHTVTAFDGGVFIDFLTAT